MGYYQLLGVDERADIRDIKKAYRVLCKRYHPDVQGDQQSMVALNQAYEVLSDPVARGDYDRTLAHLRQKAAQERAARAAAAIRKRAEEITPTIRPAVQPVRKAAYEPRQRKHTRLWAWVTAVGMSGSALYLAVFGLPIKEVQPASAVGTETVQQVAATPAPVVPVTQTQDEPAPKDPPIAATPTPEPPAPVRQKPATQPVETEPDHTLPHLRPWIRPPKNGGR